MTLGVSLVTSGVSLVTSCLLRYQTRVAGERSGRHPGPRRAGGEAGWECGGISGGQAGVMSSRRAEPTACQLPPPNRPPAHHQESLAGFLLLFVQHGDLIYIMICKHLPLCCHMTSVHLADPRMSPDPLQIPCRPPADPDEGARPEFCQTLHVKEAATRVGGERR